MLIISRGAGTGRQAGLKNPWWQHREGPIPSLGTDIRLPQFTSFHRGALHQCRHSMLYNKKNISPVVVQFGEGYRAKLNG